MKIVVFFFSNYTESIQISLSSLSPSKAAAATKGFTFNFSHAYSFNHLPISFFPPSLPPIVIYAIFSLPWTDILRSKKGFFSPSFLGPTAVENGQAALFNFKDCLEFSFLCFWCLVLVRFSVNWSAHSNFLEILLSQW